MRRLHSPPLKLAKLASQGLGIKTASKLMEKLKDGFRVIKHLRVHKKRNIKIDDDYVKKFAQALFTFEHQRVWSPQQREVVPLSNSLPQLEDAGLPDHFDLDAVIGAPMSAEEASAWVLPPMLPQEWSWRSAAPNARFFAKIPPPPSTARAATSQRDSQRPSRQPTTVSQRPRREPTVDPLDFFMRPPLGAPPPAAARGVAPGPTAMETAMRTTMEWPSQFDDGEPSQFDDGEPSQFDDGNPLEALGEGSRCARGEVRGGGAGGGVGGGQVLEAHLLEAHVSELGECMSDEPRGKRETAEGSREGQEEEQRGPRDVHTHAVRAGSKLNPFAQRMVRRSVLPVGNAALAPSRRVAIEAPAHRIGATQHTTWEMAHYLGDGTLLGKWHTTWQMAHYLANGTLLGKWHSTLTHSHSLEPTRVLCLVFLLLGVALDP